MSYNYNIAIGMREHAIEGFLPWQVCYAIDKPLVVSCFDGTSDSCCREGVDLIAFIILLAYKAY